MILQNFNYMQINLWKSWKSNQLILRMMNVIACKHKH
nr:MAG TPA: hypothetical protein [Caudoviricetes sp.]